MGYGINCERGVLSKMPFKSHLDVAGLSHMVIFYES